MNEIIRRKLARAARVGAEGGPGADHGWRLAFPRAARETAGLMIEVAQMSLTRRSLAELLELPPDRALIALLDGPEGGLGMIVLATELSSALIEMQTTGRVSATPPQVRRPTRTDAAMVAGTIDRAMEELDGLLSEEADLVWAGGFRYASFLEDPRPLGLLLEDQPYRVLTARLVLAGGAREGGLILALPAEGRGRRPATRGDHPAAASDPAPGQGFAAALGEAVLASDCVLEAVIARVTLPLRQVMALETGQILALPTAALDKISLEAMDGRRIARAKLGQNKGMRALRLAQAPAAGAAGPAAMQAEPGPARPSSLPVPAAGDPGMAGPGGPGSIGGDAADPFAGFAAPLDLGDGLLAAG